MSCGRFTTPVTLRQTFAFAFIFAWPACRPASGPLVSWKGGNVNSGMGWVPQTVSGYVALGTLRRRIETYFQAEGAPLVGQRLPPLLPLPFR